MVKTALVAPEIEIGEEVLRALNDAKFPVTVALWIFTEEYGDWQFLVSTPLYEKIGLKEAYLKFGAATSNRIPRANSFPIRLESNRRPLIRALRRMFGKSKSVLGMRLGGHSIGGVWIDDAYVYRIH